MTLNYRVADAKYAFRKLLVWLWDAVATFGLSGDSAPTRILVLRPDHIGDFVMWMPFARMLRQQFASPVHHITLIANKSVADFAANLGYFDDVWSVDRDRMDRDYRYRAAIVRRVRKAGFGVAINPLYTREFTRGDLIVRAARAPVSLGFRADPQGRDARFNKMGDAWYTSLVEADGVRIHETARNAAFARSMFAASLDQVSPWLGQASSDDCAGVARPYVLISPGSSDPRKNWPVSRFAELARRIRTATGWSVVLCGAATDVPASAQLREQIGASQVFDLTGCTTLRELQGLVQGAALVICNDTSLAHFAVAVGVTGLAIVGGGHWDRFLPYPDDIVDSSHFAVATTAMDCFGCRWRCKYELTPNGAFRCLDAVETETAWRHVEELLRQKGATRDAVAVCSHDMSPP